MAQGQWYGAIAAINELLVEIANGTTTLQADSLLPQEGVILSGPLPVLRSAELSPRFSTWTFSSDWRTALRKQLPATTTARCAHAPTSVSLLTGDPLSAEPFFMVLTAEFSLVAALGSRSRQPQGDRSQGDALGLNFSFDPAVVQQCWRALRPRVKLTNPDALPRLESLLQQFSPRAPEYQLVSQFSRRLLTAFAAATAAPKAVRSVEQVGRVRQRVDAPAAMSKVPQVVQTAGLEEVGSSPAPQGSPSRPVDSTIATSDTEILKAIAHEVRTPLATIRTLTRSLLRRRDLPGPVAKRLTSIDRECTRQIERFGLIFRAVEFETEATQTAGPLAKISLEELFQRNLDQWKQQAADRNLTLDVRWANALPTVISDPAMLNQMLTGLIDKVTHVLPAGSHIQMRVIPAGDQLKLQLYSRPADCDTTMADCASNPFFNLFSPSGLKSIGQLLMFQPETGNLSLNLDITKNIFQALGGKFTIRRHPEQGEVVTIFLPMEAAEAS